MVTISFIGDISLNDDYMELFRNGSSPFQDLHGILADSDLVVGNLESMSAGTGGENPAKKPRLKTNQATLGYLKQLNLGLACLANNHVYDNLEDGFRDTLEFLRRSDIRYIGAAQGTTDPISVLEYEIKGIRFTFFNYVDPDTNPGLPADAKVRLGILEEQRVLGDLSRSADSDFRILLLHWGGRYENSYFPGPGQIRMARTFIRGGADLIIGHHPHTLQPVYKYHGKSVYFSLGNFCFADVRSDGRIKKIRFRRWQESAIIRVQFSTDGYQAGMVPFRLEKLNTRRDPSITWKFGLRQQYFHLIRISKLFWYFYYFGFKYLRPVFWELKKSDPERSLLRRLFGLNREKLKGMFK